MLGADPAHTTAENYRWFARVELSDKSPLYAAFCEGVADDPQLLEFLAEQPEPKRQPNLLLAVVRLLFGLQPDYAAFRAAVLEHTDAVASELAARRTQTNEPGRCAALLPVLGQLQQPLALLEVGAAAGLCLLPDRYVMTTRARDSAAIESFSLASRTARCRSRASSPRSSGERASTWRQSTSATPTA